MDEMDLKRQTWRKNSLPAKGWQYVFTYAWFGCSYCSGVPNKHLENPEMWGCYLRDEYACGTAIEEKFPPTLRLGNKARPKRNYFDGKCYVDKKLLIYFRKQLFSVHQCFWGLRFTILQVSGVERQLNLDVHQTKCFPSFSLRIAHCIQCLNQPRSKQAP
jgi:hypothetical protein